jgi:hypothetical protein
MAFKYGNNTSLWLDALDVSVYFNDLTTDVTVDTADTSTFQSGWKAFIEGLPSSKVTAKGFYDATNDAELMTLIRNGGSILTAGPAGLLAIGDAARLVSIHETDVQEASPVGGAVSMSVAFQDSGVVGFGWTLHPLGVDTGTTTGADRDDGAATSTGWRAHLHVTAVSSGTWTIKLQDAATTDWTDVTGASFTATSVATSQRLSSAASTTTLRRHVRYVATVAGGSSPTITFGLAYSRN